ncbi:hypothetical protein WJX77_003056 [Trebouxia sp. C0004]
MPGKRKASGKAKKVAYLTADEDLAPFGFKLKDVIRTPLGITGTVIGVKLVEASQPETARLWVAYSSGLEAPLEPQLSAGHLSDLGYKRVSEADHVHRDIKVLEENEVAWEVRKKELTEEAAKKAAEAAEPDKKGKDADKKKK